MKNLLLGTAVVAVALLAASSPAQVVVSDNFTDGNDTANPAWTRLDFYVGSSGQTWDASTGQYRLTALNNGANNLGFVGGHVGPSLTDVTVKADVVSFIDEDVAQGGVFGVAARLNGNNNLGELTGYAYAYEPYAAQGQGEMVLYRIGPSISANDIGAQQVTLDPNKDYTFVLNITGDQLHGQVFEIGGGLVAERFATDATYASGFSGLIAYSQNPIPGVDVTIDNFEVTVPEPASGLLLAVIAGLTVRRFARGRVQSGRPARPGGAESLCFHKRPSTRCG